MKSTVLWLQGLIFLILVMVMIGGITRLTGSGLSITEWKPILGVIPPLDHAEWMAAFEKYQQIPQFKNLNSTMTLEGFQSIYFWEYFHRLIGRSLGIYLLVPFLYFFKRNAGFRKHLPDFAFLLFLGGLQGAIGWIMVKSGLGDALFVSPVRLALHLGMAMLLISWVSIMVARILHPGRALVSVVKSIRALPILLFAQCLYGALTAGSHSGFMYPTFPTMNHQWIPTELFSLTPLWTNLFANPATVQWVHRLLGTTILAYLGWRLLKTRGRSELLLLAGILLQYSLGIIVVLLGVPVWAGVIHQVVGVTLFTLSVQQSIVSNSR